MSTLVINKKTYHSLEYGFDKSFEVIGDYDLVLRTIRDRDILYLEQPLSYYRWHSSNLSHKKFRLNILELVRWKKNLSKKKNFFSQQNIKYLENHILFLKSLHYKKSKKNKMIIMFLKKADMLKIKIKILTILFLPLFILKYIRS